jgi:ribonuclease-3
LSDLIIRNTKLQDIEKNISSLESLLGFTIHDKNIYIQALTHRSYIEINSNLKQSNERLEFLGDSILSMIVAGYLFEKYESEDEGFLTKARSSLVNRERLAYSAYRLNLKDYILINTKYVGYSDEGLPSILADAFEALIGAIYYDQSIEQAEQFILKWLIYPYEEEHDFLMDKNYKGQLLEYTHAKKLDQPKYVVKGVEGPEHKREFTVDVLIGTKIYGTGKGRSKKIAEQNASKEAITNINNNF